MGCSALDEAYLHPPNVVEGKGDLEDLTYHFYFSKVDYDVFFR